MDMSQSVNSIKNNPKYISSKNVNNGGKSSLMGAGEMILLDYKEVI
jgi:hypothetical protein